MARPPWEDREKTRKEKHEERKVEAKAEEIEAKMGKCDDCGQVLWEGEHTETESCPEDSE